MSLSIDVIYHKTCNGRECILIVVVNIIALVSFLAGHVPICLSSVLILIPIKFGVQNSLPYIYDLFLLVKASQTMCKEYEEWQHKL